jgi:hypothetical protein
VVGVARCAGGPARGAPTTVTLEASLHPDAIAPGFPKYARFLRSHATPLRIAVQAREAQATWWSYELRDNCMRLQFRVHGGDLAPLGAAPRAMPERIRVTADVSTRSGAFRVGLRGLDADVQLIRAPDEKAFVATFRTQPDWQLPFLIQPLLKGPLQQPFRGEGSELGYGVTGDARGPTLLVRDYRLPVKESWIVRWLGGLVGGTVTEFRRSAEEEADHFTGEALEALRADVLALTQ